jgi:uncharacterized membrane protein YgdD (TMEM256/DUF423 family)
MHASRSFLLGALSAALTILLGAFGAHVLKDRLTPADLEIFEKGVRYQMYHAFGLCLSGLLLADLGSSRALRLAAHCFLWGTVLFSGSLYLLVLTNTRWLGAVTPFGGTLFVIGWVALALAGRRLASR